MGERKPLLIPPNARSTIVAHARAEYPNESCGLLFDNGFYLPCFNYAADPLNDFEISSGTYSQALLDTSRKITAVVHSHPGLQRHPSASDTRGQIGTAVPWVIVPLDAENVLPFTQWGDQLPMAPILGRQFLHGVQDCYSLIRDVYALGRHELAKQEIDWPLPPIDLPQFPRDDGWWIGTKDKPGENLYVNNSLKTGFIQIANTEARPGDMFYIKIKSEQANHGGLLIGGGLILHHLPTRLSRREPSGMWVRSIDRWMRYVGPEKTN